MSVPVSPTLAPMALDPTPQDFTTPKMAPDGTMSLSDFHDICNGDPEIAEYIQPGITDIHTVVRDPKSGQPHVKFHTPQAKTRVAEQHAVRQVQKASQEVPEYIPVEDFKALYANKPGQFQKDFPMAQTAGGASALIKTDKATGTIVGMRNPKHPNTQKFMQDQQKTVGKRYSPDTQQWIDKSQGGGS